MLENLKDQIHSLRWLKTEAAPAVTDQTTENNGFYSYPFRREEGDWSGSPTAYPMCFLSAPKSSILPSSLYHQWLLVIIYCKNACLNEEMWTTCSRRVIKQHVQTI